MIINLEGIRQNFIYFYHFSSSNPSEGLYVGGPVNGVYYAYTEQAST